MKIDSYLVSRFQIQFVLVARFKVVQHDVEIGGQEAMRFLLNAPDAAPA